MLLNGNPQLDFVAVRHQTALRLEDEVRAQVGGLPLDHGIVESVAAGTPGLDQRSVRLNTQRIHRKDTRLTAVVERAQQNLDVIVGCDPVAVGQRRVDRPMGFVGPDAEVNRGRRVPDQNLGRVRCRYAVGRRELGESIEDRGLSPDRLVQLAVDLDRDVRLDPGHPHIELPRATTIRDRRIGCLGERQQQERKEHEGPSVGTDAAHTRFRSIVPLLERPSAWRSWAAEPEDRPRHTPSPPSRPRSEPPPPG